jgi:asparagine synthase (glutamine-hydrolysing)
VCGIAGIFDISSIEPKVNHNILKKMSDIIIHRGPDADGQYVSKSQRCGLSFRRLSIIDLSPKGNQPMHSLNGDFSIVFNGEVYNHLDIRQDLIGKDYKYNSQTDTETILNGYMEFGTDILKKLFGMWSFAIFDEKKQELFAARDRIGIKPFYYYFKDGLFIFASEIKSILEHPAVSKEMNIDEIPNYLNYGMSSNHTTLFKNIYKLPAGHFLKLSKEKGLITERYWSPYNQCTDNFSMSSEDIYEELIVLLRRAIKDRMMSDVPFGVFLSGGIDSSLNVALMAELMERPIDTYTVGFKELEKYNELNYARQISDKYKTNHHEILIDDNDAFSIIEDLPWYEDEPNADPVCIPLYFLSKLTRQSGTVVVQVGEGSDEQFTGYKWMMRDYNFYNKYWKPFSSMPAMIKKMILAGASPILNAQNLQLPTDFIRRAVDGDEFYWSGTSIFTPTHQKQMLAEKYKHLYRTSADYANSIYKQSDNLYPNAEYIQKMEYAELTQRLAELLLMRVDKIGMAHSIEARVPFLDHRIVEFSMSIPSKLKMPDNKTTKFLLKKAVEPILPNNIIYRKKQGFWAPVNEWLRNQWYDYAKENILNSEFSKQNILDKNYLSKMLENHKCGKTNNGFAIYTILNLNLWYKKFFV